MWCRVFHDRIIGLFSRKRLLPHGLNLDMLEIYALPQLQELQPSVIFHLDDAPPHWGLIIRV